LPQPSAQQQQPAQKTEVIPSNVKAASEPKAPLELGLLNNIALSLAVPTYPEFARKAGVNGRVMVRIIIDEKGKVISAKGIEGPKMLRSFAEDASLKSRFNPTLADNQAVKATGIIVYNFIN
jgi:TonB family protein